MSLAAALADAHRTGRPVSVETRPVPVSLEAAEAIQTEVAGLMAVETAGWKVGMAPDDETVVAAPLFRHLLLPDGADYSRGEAAFLAIEIEIGFRMQADFSASDIKSTVGSAFVGVEIVRSRYIEGPKAPFPSFLADNIANGGYAIGSERADWRGLDLTMLRCRVWRDENLEHDAPGGHPQGDPLAPLRALPSRPLNRLGGLRAGQFVTTGTLCGVMRIERACSIRAEVEGLGTVSVNITD